MRKHNGASLVLDLLRHGLIVLLASVGTIRLANAADVRFDLNGENWQHTCHPTDLAALTACNNDLQYNTDNTITCQPATLGYRAQQFSGGANNTHVYHEYYSMERTSVCNSQFQQQLNNEAAIAEQTALTNNQAANLGYVETDIIYLNQDVTAIEQQIQNLSGTDTTLTTQLGAIDSRTTQSEADITTLNQRADTIDQTLIGHGTLITNSQIDLQTVQGNLQGNINVNTGLINANGFLIGSNTSRLNGIDTEVFTLKTRAQLLEEDSAASAIARSGLQTSISSNLATLSTQQTQISDIETLATERAASEAQENADILDYLTNQQLGALDDIKFSIDTLTYPDTTSEINTVSTNILAGNSLLTQLRTEAGYTNSYLVDIRGNQTGMTTAVTQTRDAVNTSNDLLANIRDNNSVGDTNTHTLLGSTNTELSQLNASNNSIDATLSNIESTLDSFAVAPTINTPIQRAISASQQESYDSLLQVPIITAFTNLGNVWIGDNTTHSCPTPSIDLTQTIMATSLVFDMHCTLITQYTSLFEILAKLVWAITAVLIFFRN